MGEQIGIAMCGLMAIWLSQCRHYDARKWACIFGLIAQPFWFLATWKAHQYGIFAVCFLYTFSWCKGFYTYWIKS